MDCLMVGTAVAARAGPARLHSGAALLRLLNSAVPTTPAPSATTVAVALRKSGCDATQRTGKVLPSATSCFVCSPFPAAAGRFAWAALFICIAVAFWLTGDAGTAGGEGCAPDAWLHPLSDLVLFLAGYGRCCQLLLQVCNPWVRGVTAFRYSVSPGIIEAAETALTAKVATMIAVSGGAANFLLVTIGVNVKVLRGA